MNNDNNFHAHTYSTMTDQIEADITEATERAVYVREHLADYLRDWRMAACDHTIGTDREPCCSPCLQDRIIAAGLLAGGVPGRSEAGDE